MLNFSPWGKSGLEVAPKLKGWLENWMPKEAYLLEPIDWFQLGHDITGGENDSQGFWRNTTKLGC